MNNYNWSDTTAIIGTVVIGTAIIINVQQESCVTDVERTPHPVAFIIFNS